MPVAEEFLRANEKSVRNDVAAYRASLLVRQDVPVRGFVYDVKTGKLREVTDR